jgi:hypothetical protein
VAIECRVCPGRQICKSRKFEKAVKKILAFSRSGGWKYVKTVLRKNDELISISRSINCRCRRDL